MALDHAAHEAALDEQFRALGVDKLIERLITRAENSYNNGNSPDAEIVFSKKESKFYHKNGDKIQLLMDRYKDNNPDQQIRVLTIMYQERDLFGWFPVDVASVYLVLWEPKQPETLSAQ